MKHFQVNNFTNLKMFEKIFLHCDSSLIIYSKWFNRSFETTYQQGKAFPTSC